jgi:hypothetical protein
MPSPISNEPIFRREALEEYARGREEAVLPEFVSARVIRALWWIGAVASGAVAVVAAVPVPVSTGASIVAPGAEGVSGAPAGTRFVISVSPEVVARIRIGQPVYRADGDDPQPVGRIVGPAPLASRGLRSVPRGADAEGALLLAETSETFARSVGGGKGPDLALRLGRSTLWRLLAGRSGTEGE